MADRLIIESERIGYQIVWFLEEESDTGARLGESTYSERDLAKAKPEDWDHITATITASKTVGVQRDGHNGYYWESRKDAAAALKAIKFALKDKGAKPWPEWAVKATAEGWKAPKGWTP